MRRLVVGLFLIAACGAPSLPQAHTVTLGYKAGDTYKYALAASLKYTIGAQGLSIPLTGDVSAKETVTVKSVDPNGTADLSVLLSDMTARVSANGTTTTTTTTTSAPIEMKVGPDGRIVSVNGSAFGSVSMPGTSLMGGGLVSAILPDGQVKPGDTWTKDYDEANPSGGGSLHVTTKNKYLRDEAVKGVTAAVIQSNIASKIDFLMDLSALGAMFPTGGGAGGSTGGLMQNISVKGTTSSDVTSWIDWNAKRLVKTHSTGKVDATMTMNISAGAGSPVFTGPITFQGTQTLDMNPA